jgi:hypothetical protein
LHLPPEPSNLSPVQAMRWREAARVLTESSRIDINDLDDATRILTTDRLRSALQDMLHLLGEASPSSPSIE